eukprot:2972443-Amphidinium_carterae.1
MAATMNTARNKPAKVSAAKANRHHTTNHIQELHGLGVVQSVGHSGHSVSTKGGNSQGATSW